MDYIREKEIDAYELWNKPDFKLQKNERKQLIAEMILYCSPEVVWVQKRNSKQPALRSEKRKIDHIKTCAYSIDNEKSS